MMSGDHSRLCLGLAWTVHLFTASGAVFGLLAIIAIARQQWMTAFLWMGVTMAIDAVDGMLARAIRVRDVLPRFDGALLDNIVDYFTYVIVPAAFLYETQTMPRGFNLVSAVLILLASAYQFCQTEAKTDDHFFTGFPSYWNVAVFYLFMLHWSPWLDFAVIAGLAIAVFVPIRYLYPSRTPVLRPLNMTLSALWFVAVGFVFLRYPEGHQAPLYASIAYVVYYILLSLYLTFLRWADHPAGESEAAPD